MFKGKTKTARAEVGLLTTLFVVLLLALSACATPDAGDTRSASDAVVPSTSSTAALASTSTSSSIVMSTSTVAPPVTESVSTRDRLAVLSVDDRSSAQGTYRRDEWPHWSDVDGNGCDARQDALIAWSTVTPTVNRSSTCKVVVGSWTSPYDLMTSNNPSDFDVDHLVPLENAFRSGGWSWSTERRRAFANNPGELVVASASSNRSKGSDPPNEWRPSNRASWCAYADGWVKVKSSWGLTVTTSERDALGQMLDTCSATGPVWPIGEGGAFLSPEGAAASGDANARPQLPVAPVVPAPEGTVYYANCTAVRAAGAAPIYAGQPGYRTALDGDKDGVACE